MHFLSEGMSFTQRHGDAEDGIVVVLAIGKESAVSLRAKRSNLDPPL